ncbi:MAG: vitamin K epoxide reductase family protein [Anaerolineae bacterium]
MQVFIRKMIPALLVSFVLALSPAGLAQAQDTAPVVRAVLFYSPTCPHCQHVIEDVLPPLYDQYGSQLQIIGVSTLESEGWALYQVAAERFSIPKEQQVVPTLIVGETVLIGADEVAEQFPGIIKAGLAAGGVALPDIPGLLELLPPETSAQAGSGPVVPEEKHPSPLEMFARDPAGNTLALIVLIGMIMSLGYVAIDGRQVLRPRRRTPDPDLPAWGWVVPVLALAGLGVALYMAYVETQGVQAACGPVGDCNTVQQSPYARLFGVLPIGVVGAIGYIAMLAAWAWRRLGSDDRRRAIASLTLFSMTAFGVLFSIYLTFLEPFVIGATCAWCLSSAVIITLLLLFTARPGMQALQVLRT